MRRAMKLSGVFVAAILVGTSLAANVEAGAATVPKDALYVPGEVVVLLRGQGRLDTPLMQARSLARTVGGRVTRVSGRSRSAVIKADPGADVRALARRLSADARVRFAEPNYIYRASAVAAPQPYVVRRVGGTTKTVKVSKAALRAMRTRTGAGIKATYPTDKLAWDNAGWDHVGASLIWSNTTASVNVCVIDTGVDYLHTDLTTTRVIKGYDFANEDADPMDDNGHGTHVAGVIAAKQNNTEGIAGVSPTAKVIAVKALNASGWGTSYDIYKAIDYCAKRTDVKIINMSFGGPYSLLQENGVKTAAVTYGKLLVAAAGNENSDMPYCTDETTWDELLKAGVRSYPAGFATESLRYTWVPDPETPGEGACEPVIDDPNTEEVENMILHPQYAGVLSVGAGGFIEDDPYPLTDPSVSPDYMCRADYSNFGDWVNLTAPGTGILSTTPWDKPFTMMQDGIDVRYDHLSGTSVAAAFVSGAAARFWGKAGTTNSNAYVAGYLQGEWGGFPVNADGVCWPASMAGVNDVNVARAFQRGGLRAYAIDAVTGLPLVGATIQALQGSPLAVKQSAVLSSVKYTLPGDPTTYLSFPPSVDLINLDCSKTTLKVTKTGYTAAAYNAFVGPYSDSNPDGTVQVPEGAIIEAGYAAVPPKGARFTAVSAWPLQDERPVPKLTTSLPDTDSKTPPSPIADGQSLDFVVGHNVCDTPGLEDDPAGELSVFPNAQSIYQVHDPEGNAVGWVDTHQIVERKVATSSTMPANVAQPWYTGDYIFRLYAPLNPDYPATSTDPGGFAGRTGSLFIWKDGVMKLRVNLDPANATCNDTTDWWEAAKITSAKSGSATYPPISAAPYPENSTCRPASEVVFPVTCR